VIDDRLYLFLWRHAGIRFSHIHRLVHLLQILFECGEVRQQHIIPKHLQFIERVDPDSFGRRQAGGQRFEPCVLVFRHIHLLEADVRVLPVECSDVVGCGFDLGGFIDYI